MPSGQHRRMPDSQLQPGRILLLAASLALIGSGCTAAPVAQAPSPTPAPSETPTSLPSTATLAPTHTVPPPTGTPTRAPTETLVPTSTSLPTVTALPSPTPRPTVERSTLPLPPPVGQGQDHLFMGRPVGAGGNAGISSSYRFGSTLGGAYRTHHGVDMGNPTGVPIVAVGSGVVVYAGADLDVLFGPFGNFYGNVVALQLNQAWNGRSVFALYGHLSDFAVTSGQPVNQGDVLGYVGQSGVADGPHLHFEVRLDDPKSYWNAYNPELWLAPASGYGALAVRLVSADGRYLPGVRVGIVCSDGAYRFVDTYWDNGVNPDPGWGENGALLDVPAGKCTAETKIHGQTVRNSVQVVPGQTAFLLLAAGQ